MKYTTKRIKNYLLIYCLVLLIQNVKSNYNDKKDNHNKHNYILCGIHTCWNG